MAYSTGSQLFIHLLNLKAIPNHFRHPVIHQIRGMIGLVSLAIFSQLLSKFLEGPNPALRWLPGWSIRFLQLFYVLSLDLIITLNIKHTVSFEKQTNKKYVVNVFKATQY